MSAKGTNHIPPGKLLDIKPAASSARRVFPIPPRPVRVRSRLPLDSRAAGQSKDSMRRSSAARPWKLDAARGRRSGDEEIGESECDSGAMRLMDARFCGTDKI